MSREKQILDIWKENQIFEDMAEEISDVWNNKCQLTTCKGCKYNDLNENKCQEKLIADHLIAKGYRKQSEGEWIEASDKPYAACGKKCSLCGARITYREFGHGNHKYCHKCGAKMKGGAE